MRLATALLVALLAFAVAFGTATAYLVHADDSGPAVVSTSRTALN